MKKYGAGEILPEPTDAVQHVASKPWDEDDDNELKRENTEADQES